MLKKMMLKKAWLGNKVSNFISSERGDVNVVSIVVLIGIAIILAIVFKDGIKKLLNSMISTISKNANNTIKVT